MKFPLTINDSQADKHQHRGNLMYVSEQSVRPIELLGKKILAYSHLKTAISLNIFFRYFVAIVRCRYEKTCMSVHIESKHFNLQTCHFFVLISLGL